MAVRIRLQRRGAKKRPFFRIIVADSRSKRDGLFIENIGYFDPTANPTTVEIKEERALEWLKRGAIPSETVKTLFEKHNILEKVAIP